MKDWNYTPYNKDVDKALEFLSRIMLFAEEDDAFMTIVRYLGELEDKVYGPTE